jgi:hypothetical protein
VGRRWRRREEETFLLGPRSLWLALFIALNNDGRRGEHSSTLTRVGTLSLGSLTALTSLSAFPSAFNCFLILVLRIETYKSSFAEALTENKIYIARQHSTHMLCIERAPFGEASSPKRKFTLLNHTRNTCIPRTIAIHVYVPQATASIFREAS